MDRDYAAGFEDRLRLSGFISSSFADVRAPGAANKALLRR
jgi:hypothetical protein